MKELFHTKMAIVSSPLSEDTHDNDEQAKSRGSRLVKVDNSTMFVNANKMERASKDSNEFDSN
jgi:hypothetical protein